MTLEEHAAVIEAAIKAAHADGFQIDDGDGEAVYCLELNEMTSDGVPTGNFCGIDLPDTYWT